MAVAVAPRTISPQDLAAALRHDPQAPLIDVRTPAEFREVHLASAKNLPLDQLSGDEVRRLAQQCGDRLLYVICQKGGRGQKACEALAAAGVQVANVVGGTQACVEAGLDVVRGQKTISLERQVRIAAGSLVLIGAALAWWVHPGFVGLSAFIGAGLVFAGVTDTCGMGMLLAKMPWNQCGDGGCCQR